MNVDPEKLIDEVEARPAIWDTNHIHYNNKVVRKQAWRSIVDTLIDEPTSDEEDDEKKRTELTQLLMKKWKNLRDRYSREVIDKSKKGEKGRGGKRRAPYIHAQQLSFLRDVMNPSQNSASSEIASIETVVKGEEVDIYDNYETPEGSVDSSIHEKKIKRLEDPLSRDLEEYVVQKDDFQRREEVEEDDDRLFVLSLLPSMRGIPQNSKLNARIEIMMAINKYANGNFAASKSN